MTDNAPAGGQKAKLDEAVLHYNENSANTYHLRSPEQITRFFDGLEVLEPGVVPLLQWRPDATPFADPEEVPGYAGMARKP